MYLEVYRQINLQTDTSKWRNAHPDRGKARWRWVTLIVLETVVGGAKCRLINNTGSAKCSFENL